MESAHEADRNQRVGLYIRFSTQEQKMNSYSAEMQRDQCMQKLHREHPDTHHTVRVFEDLGISGSIGVSSAASPAKQHRQGLTELLNAIANGELDMVLVYSQDRLAREEFLWHYMNETIFQRYQIPVLFARESHDILTEEGQMISSIHALVAALERRKISRNVSAAAERRAQEGFAGGPPPYGWKWDAQQNKAPRERRRIVRHESQGAVLLEMRERYLSGWPTAEIVRDLHRRGIESPRGGLHWNTDGVLKVIRNPVNAGLVRHRQELYQGQHTPLRYWSPEDRKLLLQRISERADRSLSVRNVERFLLSGVVFCGHCGRRLTGSTDSRRDQRMYGCPAPRTGGNNRVRRNGEFAEVRTCPGLHRSADELEAAVIKAVAELARSAAVQSAAVQKVEDAIDQKDARISAELTAVEKELQQVDQGFSRLFGLLDKGAITEDEFNLENERRRDQQKCLVERQEQLSGCLSQRRGRKAELERALALLRDFDRLWESMPPGEQKEMLRQIDPHMTLRREDNYLILTIAPGFAEPINITFVARPRKHPQNPGPDARLTPRQLALLCRWEDGDSLQDMAHAWDISIGTVRWVVAAVRERLAVKDLDEAVELVRDRLDKCRNTLSLKGRYNKRPVSDPTILSEVLLAVLQLLAEGKRCVEIAKTLGKDKSTVSRQIRQVYYRLGAENREAALSRARELGLIS